MGMGRAITRTPEIAQQVPTNIPGPGFQNSIKLISQHWGVQRSPFLEEMALTHYILRYICFWTPPIPPICLKTPKCAIFSTFRESHLKHTPKVGVHRENLLIGNVAQNIFRKTYMKVWVLMYTLWTGKIFL